VEAQCRKIYPPPKASKNLKTKKGNKLKQNRKHEQSRNRKIANKKEP